MLGGNTKKSRTAMLELWVSEHPSRTAWCLSGGSPPLFQRSAFTSSTISGAPGMVATLVPAWGPVVAVIDQDTRASRGMATLRSSIRSSIVSWQP